VKITVQIVIDAQDGTPPAMHVGQGAWGIIRLAASSLKPLPERSASTQECPRRWISRSGRQAGC